ncbi:tetratricopeptide repeat protein [Variovorax sp. J22R24]|uniref:tetratricopeptide repeat protein n=1 Tax=Variovorax gracilis TaxID=3053502 RepID=UPI002577DA15|nr:tetratricopeptide repeat protein [Variovorax sp. J22R24]MDM0108555.1 tetratricopeptide repeat protein [Variovorax sp. J22R24]
MTTLLRDANGESLSTTDRASAEAYDHALDLFNSYRTDPVAVLTPVLERDPEFVSGQLLMAGLMLSAFDPRFFPMAQACVDAAAASRQRADAREQSLQAALATWCCGDLLRANQMLGRHLIDHPRDILALQLAHVGDLVLGQTFMLRDRVARALSRWSLRDRSYGYVLGMHAFGLEECNEYERAQATGRRAFELQPHDAWAIHSVAHVCEMQGRVDDGIDWLEATQPHWAQDNGLAVHNHWHLALMHLNRDDAAAALALYDRSLVPAPEAISLNLNDASAMLWRLSLRGAVVGERWQALAARLREQHLFGHIAFNDVHAMLALISAGDEAGGREGSAAILAAADRPGAPPVWHAVAVPACHAVRAFVDGRYTDAAELLLTALSSHQSLGGSHAQRDLLHLTALEAATRAGNRALAGALADERALRKGRVHGHAAQMHEALAA